MNSSGRRGDQIVNLRVVTPTDLNSEQTRLLQELAASFGIENAGDGNGPGFFDRVKDAFQGKDQ